VSGGAGECRPHLSSQPSLSQKKPSLSPNKSVNFDHEIMEIGLICRKKQSWGETMQIKFCLSILLKTIQIQTYQKHPIHGKLPSSIPQSFHGEGRQTR
jgi:hypothetical protein